MNEVGKWWVSGALILSAAASAACDDKAKDAPKPAASAASAESDAAAASTPPPAASSAAPAAEVTKPTHPCPKGSTGDGTFDKPCEASGKARLVTATWNGKISEKGPTFKIVNTTDLDVLYGKIVVYFYDKAGKPLKAGDKDHLSCGGNIFAGPLKPKEKAFLNFSCVKKDHVPEGATAIEGELEMIGFPGADPKKSDTYWRNKDLTPDARPKGGPKK